jgi:hypothetical protein
MMADTDTAMASRGNGKKFSTWALNSEIPCLPSPFS